MAKIRFERKYPNYQYNGARGEFHFGAQANTDGKGMAISSTRTALMRIFSDTGGSSTTGNIRGVVSRTLIGTAQTAAGTISALVGQVKSVKNFAGDWVAGLWGYFEASGTLTLTPANAICGVRATIDAPSGVTIASGKQLAALVLDSVDLNGTHTGKAVGIYARNAGAGAFDAFLSLDADSQFVGSSGAGGSTSKYLKVLLGGVAYSILMKNDAD